MYSKEKFFHPIKGLITATDLEETEALLILSSFPGLGSIRIQRLVTLLGSATAALLAGPERISSLIGGGHKIIEKWHTWPKEEEWKRNLALVAKYGISLVSFKDESYPKRLLSTGDFPPLLYLQGEMQPQDQKCIAIVGTRHASIYGSEMAALFGKELAAHGITIVSGLARGIDTAAHIGALESGRTIAVIGSGLADIYPKENRSLAHQIQNKGACLSELPMMTPPDRQNFPQRNRIVAGMVEGILLIEAPINSGAMLTMQMGLANQRKLFALPGRVDMNFSGNHALIKRQEARLVESPLDILQEIAFDKGASAPPLKMLCGVQLDKAEKELLKHLPLHEISIDALSASTNIAIPQLNALLMSLLLKGAIKEFPGRIYKKIRE